MKTPDHNIVSFIKDLQKDKAKNVIVIPHINPDGDAIGSSMALYHFFSKTNPTNVIAPSSFPEFLKWMPNSDDVFNYKEEKEECNVLISKADLIVIADHNAPNRSGEAEEAIINSNAKILMIDHHPEPSYPRDYSISSIEVSSTAELVFNFISTINPASIDTDMAAAMYVGIMTDTGNFMHNVHPDTFKIVSELTSKGINRDGIYNKVFNNYSVDRMRLLGFALGERMDILEDLGVAIMHLEKTTLEQFNYQIGDTEGFVNMPLAIKGISASILVMERNEEIKMSFRSKGNVAINIIAKKYFKGGGHKNAAGGTSNEESVFETVVKLKEILKKESQLLLEQ